MGERRGLGLRFVVLKKPMARLPRTLLLDGPAPRWAPISGRGCTAVISFIVELTGIASKSFESSTALRTPAPKKTDSKAGVT
jgi:hypothetical protein